MAALVAPSKVRH